ncbi:MAG: C69 family dipeptidase [Alloprevotella sp.]|nr:C69 family dipeptidase [Alloprevotella sp.]
MKRILLLLAGLLAFVPAGLACTNFLVGKKASTDGSVFITYNADSYGMYGRLIYLPHAKHEPGTMRKIYDGDTNHYYGEIPEAAETYAVMGYINEYQLSIMETTFGGREELVDPNGKIDYVSLMRLGLQRAKTAREAIKVMTQLVAEYGYASEGESFSIADPNEVWIMEMIGKGPGERGANWVAVRVPDDCIACHANHSRIRKYARYTDTEVLASDGIIDFARAKGFFTGDDKDFDFSAAFAPADFGAIRYCETRVWSFYNRFVEGMDKYLKYADGRHMNEPGVEPMPLYMKPKRLLTRQDMMDGMRDHYEGTPFDVQKDCGMGPGEMPYRPTPLTFEYEGKKYFNERPISTQQTADTYIAQLRSWLPDMVGGVLWYGQDDPNMIAYVPIYCQNTEVPECFDAPDADATHFSRKSSFWVCNWVSNMVYPRYNQLFPVLRKKRDALDNMFGLFHTHIEEEALHAYKNTSPEAAREKLTQFSLGCAQRMHEEWLALAERLIVEFNDMCVKPRDASGEYKMTEDGLPVAPQRPGYPDSYRKKIVEEAGERYLLPE